MKPLLVLLVCVGVGNAASTDTVRFNPPQDYESRILASYGTVDHVLTVKIPIECDHQWKESEYRLLEITLPKKGSKEGAVRLWNKEATDDGTKLRGNVEVCSKCGLIRISPKDLKQGVGK